jgi:hypothetical protein
LAAPFWIALASVGGATGLVMFTGIGRKDEAVAVAVFEGEG